LAFSGYQSIWGTKSFSNPYPLGIRTILSNAHIRLHSSTENHSYLQCTSSSLYSTLCDSFSRTRQHLQCWKLDVHHGQRNKYCTPTSSLQLRGAFFTKCYLWSVLPAKMLYFHANLTITKTAWSYPLDIPLQTWCINTNHDYHHTEQLSWEY